MRLMSLVSALCNYLQDSLRKADYDRCRNRDAAKHPKCATTASSKEARREAMSRLEGWLH